MEVAFCLQLVSSAIFAHLESDWIWGRGVLKVMFICSLVKSATGCVEQHLREGKCHSSDTFFLMIFALVVLLLKKKDT